MASDIIRKNTEGRDTPRPRGEETHNPSEIRRQEAMQERMAEYRKQVTAERKAVQKEQNRERRTETLESARSAMQRGDMARMMEILRAEGLGQSDLVSYMRRQGGEIRADCSNPSFGSLKSDAYYKTSELKRDLAAGREVAVHNRINELGDIAKKMAKEEQAKLEKKKQEELEKQKKAEEKKKAEEERKKQEEEAKKKAEEERKKKEAEAKKKAEEERKKKEAEEKRRKEEEERKKQQK